MSGVVECSLGTVGKVETRPEKGRCGAIVGGGGNGRPDSLVVAVVSSFRGTGFLRGGRETRRGVASCIPGKEVLGGVGGGSDWRAKCWKPPEDGDRRRGESDISRRWRRGGSSFGMDCLLFELGKSESLGLLEGLDIVGAVLCLRGSCCSPGGVGGGDMGRGLIVASAMSLEVFKEDDSMVAEVLSCDLSSICGSRNEALLRLTLDSAGLLGRSDIFVAGARHGELSLPCGPENAPGNEARPVEVALLAPVLSKKNVPEVEVDRPFL